MANETSIQVGEAARLARVTVRTLHHYDAIGLLRPTFRSTGEYRLYSRADLERLLQIRLYRSLEMPLEEIRSVLDDPEFDPVQALRNHRERLLSRVTKANTLISTIDEMLDGAEPMSAEKMFEGFPQEELEQEAEQRWGDTSSWKTSKQRTADYSKEKLRAIRTEHEELLEEFAACMRAGDAPSSTAALDLAERARLHIDRWFYPLSRAAHVKLSQLYVGDPKFEVTYEKVAIGLARFVTDAITANGSRGC